MKLQNLNKANLEAPKNEEFFCTAKCKFMTPSKYGVKGMVANMIQLNLKDKKLTEKLNRQKPPIMIFGCADVAEKLNDGDLIKIIDPIFTHDIAGDMYLFDMYIPVFTNCI